MTCFVKEMEWEWFGLLRSALKLPPASLDGGGMQSIHDLLRERDGMGMGLVAAVGIEYSA